MAVLTFAGTGSNYSTTQDEWTIRMPTGYAVGDILILAISIRGSSMPVPDPAFWKPIASANNGNISTSASTATAGFAVFWGKYTGGTVPLTVTRDRASDTVNDVHTHNVLAIRGSLSANPIGNFSTKIMTAADAVSLFTTIPSIDTTTPDELIILLGFGARNGTYRVPVLDIVDPAPGDFAQTTHASSSTGADTLLATWMANKATPGATGNARIEHSTTSRHSAMMLAIRGEGVAPAPLKGRRQGMVLIS
jgi:hypothetical protein